MPLDRRKGLQAAERLLKQGKVQAALSELQRVSESAPDDLLTLNRLGDLLARQGRNAEAIDYYRRIADQFAQGGFFPKASAIHKKILRIDPNNLESLVKLGELYLNQNLHGEARNYLLHAANQFLQAQQFQQAREVYQRLVDAEPDDLRHRVRLAETHAAEGDGEAAGTELLDLGRSLLDAGNTSEAEKVFSRAGDLLPGSGLALLGLSDCLAAQDRADEALGWLDKAAQLASVSPDTAGELAVRYEGLGRAEQARTLLGQVAPLEIAAETWRRMFEVSLGRGGAGTLWERLDPALQAPDNANAEAVAELLEQLGELEPEGHVPALQRLLRFQESRGETQGTIRAMERLIRSYRARSMPDQAESLSTRLQELAPEATVPVTTPDVAVGIEIDADALTATTTPAPKPAATASKPIGDLPPEAEAPAVPLSRADEEFVAGRLTQSEVLEKYGLRAQALDQVEEVTAKFPGHVKAQESLVALVRTGDDEAKLRASLANLALARRAAGDHDGAAEAAAEAAAGALDSTRRELLQKCGLLEQETAMPDGAVRVSASSAEEETAVIGTSVAPEIDVDISPIALDGTASEAGAAADPPAPTAPPAAAQAPQDVDDVFVIDLDEEPAGSPATATASAEGAPTRTATPDMLEEIQQFVGQGAGEEARRRITALRSLGYAGPELDSLESSLDDAIAVPLEEGAVPVTLAEEPEQVAPSAAAVAEPSAGEATEDEELKAITEALESELFVGASGPVVPEEDPEQSIDEIFATFKEAVQEQVSSDDYRTHYDLGIAYKEMGLVDEAISEFEISSKSPEIYREACTMIGLCYRENQEMDKAVNWYRHAIEAAGDDRDALSRLRYDLGEVLLEAGDQQAALTEFRDVQAIAPGYRDVAGRISELETQLQP